MRAFRIMSHAHINIRVNYFFFREIKRLNLKDTVSYKANTDTWYSNEMYKQQQKIMLSITNYNHKS